MGHSLRRDRQVLPLEGSAWRAEVVLLPQQFPEVLSTIAREGQLEFLRAGDFRLLDFQGDMADRLRAVEGKDHELLTRLPGDPAGSSLSPMFVEDMIDGMLG